MTMNKYKYTIKFDTGAVSVIESDDKVVFDMSYPGITVNNNDGSKDIFNMAHIVSIHCDERK